MLIKHYFLEELHSVVCGGGFTIDYRLTLNLATEDILLKEGRNYIFGIISFFLNVTDQIQILKANVLLSNTQNTSSHAKCEPPSDKMQRKSNQENRLAKLHPSVLHAGITTIMQTQLMKGAVSQYFIPFSCIIPSSA